jgi:hypothetical protein
MLAESLLNAPAVLPLDLRRVENALLPILPFQKEVHNFGTMLEPRYIVGTERLDQ